MSINERQQALTQHIFINMCLLYIIYIYKEAQSSSRIINNETQILGQTKKKNSKAFGIKPY